MNENGNGLGSNPKFEPGQKVVYIGERFPIYQNLDLTIESSSSGFYCCRKPDGYLTTWLNPDELKLVF